MADATTVRKVALVDEPIDVGDLHAAVAGPGMGAISLFLGVVRNVNVGREVTGIDYEAYRPMAIAEMERIVSEVEQEHTGLSVALVHRLGELTIGDISVGIAAAHARRAQAMQATRTVIEALKQRVPIWKREHYVDGEWEWVDPTSGSVNGQTEHVDQTRGSV